jgi:hypothetical protein
MGSVAQSMAETSKINREIADRQKLAMVLQSRAYLSAGINAAMFQDENHVFEVQAVLRNHGNTPAYDVTFRSVADIIEAPIPDDFAFPLPDETASTSVSFMAPGTNKLITRSLTERVSDDQVEGIKRSTPPKVLAMWGTVKYKDAFGEYRNLKFAFIVPEPVMSSDTARHNEAD